MCALAFWLKFPSLFSVSRTEIYEKCPKIKISIYCLKIGLISVELMINKKMETLSCEYRF